MKTCLTNAFFFFISHSRPLIFRYRKRRYQLTNRGVEPIRLFCESTKWRTWWRRRLRFGDNSECAEWRITSGRQSHKTRRRHRWATPEKQSLWHGRSPPDVTTLLFFSNQRELGNYTTIQKQVAGQKELTLCCWTASSQLTSFFFFLLLAVVGEAIPESFPPLHPLISPSLNRRRHCWPRSALLNRNQRLEGIREARSEFLAWLGVTYSTRLPRKRFRRDRRPIPRRKLWISPNPNRRSWHSEKALTPPQKTNKTRRRNKR